MIQHGTHPSTSLATAITWFSIAGMLFVWVFVPSSMLVLRTWLITLTGFAALWLNVLSHHHGTLHVRTDTIVLLGFSLTHLLPPLYLSVRSLSALDAVDIWGVSDMYPTIALVTCLGAFALLAGYYLLEQKLTRRMPIATVSTGKSSPMVLVLMTVIVIWSARAILLLSGAYYWVYKDADFLFGQWYSITGQIARYGMVIPLWLWLLGYRSPRWRLLAWSATIAELAWVLPSGARQTIIETLFGLLLIMWWRSKRPPLKWLSAVFILAVIILPIYGEYRYTIQSYIGISSIDPGASVNAINAAIARLDTSAGGTLFLDSMLTRFYDGQYFGYLLKNYRSVYDWAYGATYYTRVPLVFLPYFLYPDRPILQVPIDLWFRLVGGGSSPSTFLGEAFVNFGYPGVLIVPFFMGLVLALYERITQRWLQDPMKVGIYLLTASGMPFMVTQSFAAWLGYLRNAILMLVIVHVVLRATMAWGTYTQRSWRLENRMRL